MSIQSDIKTALDSVAGGRVYPQAAPQDAPLPFVIYRRTSNEPQVTIHGPTIATTRSTFVFECYAETFAEALTTATAVRTAIDASALDAFPVAQGGEEYEPLVDAFMEPVEYGFWH